MFNLTPFETRDMSLFDYFDNMEKRFFGNHEKSITGFRTDITDEGNQYHLKADLPGFQKDDITVEIKNDILTIQGKIKEENEETQGDVIRKERKSGSFARSFEVGNIDKEQIQANYQDGVLDLILPKTTQPEEDTWKIEIK